MTSHGNYDLDIGGSRHFMWYWRGQWPQWIIRPVVLLAEHTVHLLSPVAFCTQKWQYQSPSGMPDSLGYTTAQIILQSMHAINKWLPSMSCTTGHNQAHTRRHTHTQVHVYAHKFCVYSVVFVCKDSLRCCFCLIFYSTIHTKKDGQQQHRAPHKPNIPFSIH
jgi:hypothetical protein